MMFCLKFGFWKKFLSEGNWLICHSSKFIYAKNTHIKNGMVFFVLGDGSDNFLYFPFSISVNKRKHDTSSNPISEDILKGIASQQVLHLYCNDISQFYFLFHQASLYNHWFPCKYILLLQAAPLFLFSKWHTNHYNHFLRVLFLIYWYFSLPSGNFFRGNVCLIKVSYYIFMTFKIYSV